MYSPFSVVHRCFWFHLILLETSLNINESGHLLEIYTCQNYPSQKMTTILCTDVSVHYASQWVWRSMHALAARHLWPYCYLQSQESLCTACAWGPAWCDRSWPLLILYLGPVPLPPWLEPKLCCLSVQTLVAFLNITNIFKFVLISCFILDSEFDPH